MFHRLLIILCVIFSLSPVSAQEEDFLPDNLPPITPENAGQLQQIAMLGYGNPGEAAWSPDSTVLAVASSVGVWLYDANDWTAPPRLLTAFTEMGHFFDGSFGPLVEFSPDGTVLALSNGLTIQLWDTTTWTLSRTLEGISEVQSIAFSPDGRQFLAAGDAVLVFWDTATWELEKIWHSPKDGNYVRFSNITFSPDGRIVATTAIYNGSFVLWNPHARTLATAQIARLGDTYFDDMVTSIAFRPDGRQIAVAGIYGGFARFFDPQSKAALSFVQTPAISLAFSPDGRFFGAANSGFVHPVGYFGPTDVTLFDARTGVQVALWSGHEEVRVLAFSPNSQLLVAVSRMDGNIRIWDVQQQREIAALQEGGMGANYLAFTPDGQSLGINSYEHGGAALLNLATGAFTGNALGTDHYVSRQPAVTADSDLVFIEMRDRHLFIEHLLSGEEFELPFRDQGSGLAISDDGNLLIRHTSVREMTIWDMATGELLLEIPFDSVFSGMARFSPDNRLLTIAAGHEHRSTLRVMDVQTAEILTELVGHTDGIYQVAFGDNSIATAGREHSIIVWDLDTGKPLHTFTDIGFVRCCQELRVLQFSPDGRELIFGSGNGQIFIWNLEDGTQRLRLEAHTSSIAQLALSSSGRLIVSTDYDGIMRVWDYTTGELLAALDAHPHPIDALSIHPDDTLIATSSRDGTVRFWAVPAEAE